MNRFLFIVLGLVSLCLAKRIDYVPMFDFDVNLLTTDARLMAMQRINGNWVPVNLTDEEWSQVKDNPDFMKNPNMDFYRQYSDEDGYDTLKQQVLRAVDDPINFGSAFPLWKKHVMNAVPFFIITARSHFASSVRSAMETFIRKTLTNDEYSEMKNNFLKNSPIYDLSPAHGWWGEAYDNNSDNILKNYLYGCDFFPVSSPFWAFRHSCGDTAPCKAFVVRQLVPYALAFQDRAKKVAGRTDLCDELLRRQQEQHQGSLTRNDCSCR